jgi:hypothetical protein
VHAGEPLGQLGDDTLMDAWNSASARDLRRAQATWDHPYPCATCRSAALAPVQVELPFVTDELQALGFDVTEVEPALEVIAPPHMSRLTGPPKIRISAPPGVAKGWRLSLARGGKSEHIHTWSADPREHADGSLAFDVPDRIWSNLEPNLGYWLGAFVLADGRPLRSPTLRCLIRHQPRPRLPESSLRYAVPNPAGQRHTHGRGRRTRPLRSLPEARHVDRREYLQIVARTRTLLAQFLPTGATVLVVSKGDDDLIQIERRRGWHYPRADDGGYAYQYPAGGEDAIEEIIRLERRGAHYIAFPATAFWWLHHYPELTEYLRKRCTSVVEDSQTCVVLALEEKTT